MIKLEQKVNSKDNNFDFLRFVAASSVIVSHTYPLLGLKEPVLGSYNTLGGLAVSVFFIISGFLITKSWYDNPKISIFFKKRVLRIFPAMIAAILFGLFIIGPVVTSFDIKDYFSNPETWSYLKNVFLFSNQYNLPGVFSSNPIPMIVNGTLWTLPIEFFMYISIAIIGLFGLIFRRKVFVPISLLVLLFLDTFVIQRPEYRNIVIFAQPIVVEMRLPIFFFMGSIFYLYSEKINLDIKLAILALIVFITSFGTPFSTIIGYFILTYLTIYFAFEMDFSWLRRFGKFGDFSYGMYVYAWPIQQSIVHISGNLLNPMIFFVSAFIPTLMLAILSWNLIEKPALKLKYSKIEIFNH